ncbi:hypothetical protein [Achromobacter sp. ACM04]|uniref:hypothetical protein n=1 Tax=Achromobacter sp. ACM04 TaxID=2769312 RepID=UPI00177FD99F|nr:hypothetical protein [Achromobacter sp. ACM04]
MLHIQSKDGAARRHERLLRWRPMALLAAACAAVAILLAAGCSGIVGGAANTIYPSLSQPEEIEAPPTFTTYLPSAATQAILGGRGQGLNCSIPPLLARLAFESGRDESDVSLRFRQACVMHDMCYRHGYATYRYTQSDCDTMLQQSAFRLCRQINRPPSIGAAGGGSQRARQDDVQNAQAVYDACETEAKKVLLGVTLGGGGSYLAADRSTYFEYDPMPAGADDYVVARAVPAMDVQNDKGDIGIRTFYFQRNTVEMAMLMKPAPGKAGLARVQATPVLFPQRLIATPPVLWVPGAPADPFVALARESFGNTDLTVVRFQTRGVTVAGDLSLALSPCPQRIGSLCVSNADASIRKLASVDGRPVLLSLTHRGTLGTSSSASGDDGRTVKIVQKDLSSLNLSPVEQEAVASGGVECRAGTSRVKGADGKFRCVMDDYSLNGSRLIRNKYRFLQHDLLLEQDTAGNATHAWVLARGAALGTVAGESVVAESSGKDYKSRLVVVRQALGDRKHGETQRFGLEVQEADEPLSLVRMGAATGTALLGVSWSKGDLERVEGGRQPFAAPVLKLWKMPNAGQAPQLPPEEIALPAALRDGFLSVPPSIVRLAGIDQPLLIFVRVDDPVAQDGRIIPEKAKVVRIRFQVVPLDDVSLAAGVLKTAGEFSCVIDLDRQGRLPAASELRARALRALGMDSEKNKDPAIVLPGEVRDRLSRDLSYRWRMSQFIASERRADDGGGLLALTMVFNGFPALSTQMLLRPSPDGLSFVQDGGCIGEV